MLFDTFERKKPDWYLGNHKYPGNKRFLAFQTMAEEQNSQTIEKPAETAPVDVGIDSLLPNIPELKELFTEEPPKTTGQPEQKPTEEVPATEPGTPETALEDVIPEGLKPEGDKPLEPEPKKEEELSEGIQKRIDKLTAQKKSAEERATALEAELTDLKSKYTAPPQIAPTAADPLADIETETDLSAKIAQIQEAKDWCLRNLDGGKVSDGKGGTIWLDGSQVKETLANADKMLTVHAPNRKQFLVNKNTFETEARREYPAIFKQGTEPNKVYNQWCTVFPECRRYPDIALIIGDALVGQQIRLNRAKARNGKSPPVSQAIPLAPPSPAASPRSSANKALSGKNLVEAFENNPRAALDNFVDSLIDGGAAQRAAKR